MVYRGRVEHGAIQLDEAPTLPEGAEVEVRLLAEKASVEADGKTPSIIDSLRDLIGSADGLPTDMSVNVDHYLYGLPKRQ